MWLRCVTAEWSGRHLPTSLHERHCGSTNLVLLPFRVTIHRKEEKQQMPKGLLPSGQAARPKLITAVNLSVTLTSLETLTPNYLYTENKEKLCDD